MTQTTDLLGRPLTATEVEVLAIYDRLQALAARADLAPCVASNTRFALAAVWQMVTDLGLRLDQLDHLRV